MEDAIAELSDNSAQMLKELQEASPEDLAKLMSSSVKRSTIEATVYGVRINDRKVPTSFLFAASINDRNQHVAEIFAKDLKTDVYHKIVRKLNGAIQSEPQFETSREAVWVKPVVTCRLSYQAIQEGELTDVAVEAFVLTQRGSRD
jgi:histidyl-tRNA synthetase